MNTLKKIAFISLEGTYAFNKIGGIDSIIRRLTKEYSGMSIECYLLSFNSITENTEEVFHNVFEIKLKSLNHCLAFIKNQEIKESIIVYLPFKERIKFLFTNKKVFSRFHILITVYNSCLIKRLILFFESIISYRNGYKICLSSRIYKWMRIFSSKSILLIPPVDDTFFNEKKVSKRSIKKIAFMGRLDYGKGADIAVDFFKYINEHYKDLQCYVFGYPWAQDPFSRKLHSYLSNQKQINYVETKLLKYDKKVDDFLKVTIDKIDLFILPYRFMHSTIDTPLVPLEILARGKNFIGPRIGVLKDLVPDNHLLLKQSNIGNIELFKSVQYYFDNINDYYSQNIKLIDKLNYKTSSVSIQLLKYLLEK